MNAIGLAVPAGSVDDHYVAALVDALAGPVIEAGMNLITRFVADESEEEKIYRHWASTGGVAGVVLLRAQHRDPRVPLLRTLGFPLAAVVDATQEADFPAVVVDVNASVSVLRAFLATRPHRRTAYLVGTVRGSARFRAAAFDAIAAEDDAVDVIRIENSAEAAVTASAGVLVDGPATLVFDSDVHAAAVLETMRGRGLEVPDDVAIVSWTYSSLCQSASRSITAINRRGGEVGALLGAQLLRAVAGQPVARVVAPEPFIVIGESA